jgi:hypothetical protein
VPAWNSPRRCATGKPPPGRCSGRLAERGLEGRRLGPRAARAIDENGAMTMLPPVVPGAALHRGAEALKEESDEAQRESGTGLTVGCRREP